MRSLKRAQWLATIVLLLTAGLLVGLLGRVAWIERHITQDSITKGLMQTTGKEGILAKPGEIRSAEGTVLAGSVRVYNLFADPGYIVDPEGKLNALKGEDVQKAKDMLAEALAPLMGKEPGEIIFQIDSNATYVSGKPRRFLWLAKEVDDVFFAKFKELKAKMHGEAVQALKEVRGVKDAKEREAAKQRAALLAHALDGVNFVESIKREYPLGPLAGQVIGFANKYEGVDGLESQFNDLLKGRAGQLFNVKDATRHTMMISERGYKPEENGCNIWLTIDTVVQNIAEEELANACVHFKSESGVAIVMEPVSGRIVAMANWPPFDPSHYQDVTPKQRRNMAFDPYEPGSIFKPFVLAWAIEKKIVKPTDVFECHGGRWYDPTGRLVTDTHGYGAMTVEDILIKSSNIGMTQIGWKMGMTELHEAVTRFGFGERTGVELPGDEKGIVHPLSQWNKGTLTSVSFGYEAAATPLQLVRAFATFGNNGYLVTPRVMHAVEIEPGKTVGWQELAGPAMQKQIISVQTCDTMRKIMEGVYLTGTAKSAKSRVYRFFGKTGTAHLAIKGAGHYAGDQFNSSFLTGGPMTDPKLVVVVTLHKPDRSLGHFGGTVAAPAASQILERALLYQQVPPDQVPETGKHSDPLAGF